MKNFKNILAELVATFCYVGKIKYCPGTFGSLVAFPVYIALFSFTVNQQIRWPFANTEIIGQQIISSWLILLIFTISLYFIGQYFVHIYLNYLASCNKNFVDPKQVVIDEVAGQLLVISLCLPSLYTAPWLIKLENFINAEYLFFYFILLNFALFRFFDIFKPWPICWFDQNIKGAQGVMLDDIIAAIFATVSYYAIIFMLVNYL